MRRCAVRLAGVRSDARRLVHVAHRRFDMRPRRLEQRAVAGVAKDFGGEEDELPVLSFSGTGSAPREVDAAGHLAVFELVRGEPAQIVGRDVARARAAASDSDIIAPSRIHERA